MEYARIYKKIKPTAVKFSKETAPKLWSEPIEHRKMYAIKWLIKMSKLYNIECPRFIFNPDEEGIFSELTGGGQYIPGEHVIIIHGKYSFVTLAHEFRHAVQYTSDVKIYKEDLEEDARAWSLSLFKKACPKSYKKAKERGILHIWEYPEDEIQRMS